MPYDTTPCKDLRYGRSEKKNIALAPRHAPLGGCDQEANLRRGQGFRRTAPSASPRSEDRHVQGPPGSEEKRILSRIKQPRAARTEGISRARRIPQIAPEFIPTGGIRRSSGQTERRLARQSFKSPA